MRGPLTGNVGIKGESGRIWTELVGGQWVDGVERVRPEAGCRFRIRRAPSGFSVRQSLLQVDFVVLLLSLSSLFLLLKFELMPSLEVLSGLEVLL